MLNCCLNLAPTMNYLFFVFFLSFKHPGRQLSSRSINVVLTLLAETESTVVIRFELNN